jgi:F-type H+-transporting ATPase subunit delta
VSRGQARQYARALLVLAQEQGADVALRVRDELRELAALKGEHRGLSAALDARGMNLADRGRALVSIAESAGAWPLVSQLLGLMARRDDLSLLPALAEAYGDLVNAARGIVPVEATGAVELTPEQASLLAEAVRGATGSEVELATKVDPEVLGGLRVKMQGRTYDGTVRAQLDALRRRLATGS